MLVNIKVHVSQILYKLTVVNYLCSTALLPACWPCWPYAKGATQCCNVFWVVQLVIRWKHHVLLVCAVLWTVLMPPQREKHCSQLDQYVCWLLLCIANQKSVGKYIYQLREIHYICIHVMQPFVQLEYALYGLCTAVLGTFLRRAHFTHVYY